MFYFRKVNCKLLASDLIEAPETVFRFLCNRFKLSNVPVYDKLDEALISRYKQAISGVGSGFLAAPVMIAGDQTVSSRQDSGIASAYVTILSLVGTCSCVLHLNGKKIHKGDQSFANSVLAECRQQQRLVNLRGKCV